MNLSEADYLERTLGCLRGKAIGGTLGAPAEGKMIEMNYSYYDPVPQGAIPNDDFDLQVLNLEAVEQVGGRVDARLLARAWLARVDFPWDEYGVALLNLRRGLLPPVCGWFDNPFADCMGSPIRSELWALLAPGLPARAAWFAMQDAMVDHGTEGIAGEMYLAACEALAFAAPASMEALLRAGLGFIPSTCRTRAAVDLVLAHYRGLGWQAMRALVLERCGHPNFTDAPQNMAFTIMGLLYHPDDFDAALCTAVNCGYDTDCTGATLGALWGIWRGGKFEEKWLKPISDAVLLNHGVRGVAVPLDNVALARHILKVRGMVEARYAGQDEAAFTRHIAEAWRETSRVDLSPDRRTAYFYRPSPVISGAQVGRVSGAISEIHTVHPFQIERDGDAIRLQGPVPGEYLPPQVDLFLVGGDGSQYQVPLLNAHQLWLGRHPDKPDFAALAQKPLDELAKAGKVKPFDMPERLVPKEALAGAEWVHLAGFIQVGYYDRLGFGLHAECPAYAFIDGQESHVLPHGQACLPSPHRFGGGNPVVHGLDVKGGWYRWDIFLDRRVLVHQGLVALTLCDWHSRHLVDFRFHRAIGGVYAHHIQPGGGG